MSAAHWLSPTWVFARVEREAVGRDGDTYAWAWLLVSEIHGGRLVSAWGFDVDDEEAAFAYGKQRERAGQQPTPTT